MPKIYPFLSTFIITIGLSSFAFANTDDGETPAAEAVCDILIGGTPGLYGLCVAYCEAQDGEVDLTSEEAIMNLSAPSRKVLTNYDRKMKEGDPKMPCVNYQSSCPGWSPAELEDIGMHNFVLTEVVDEVNQIYSDSESSLFNGSVRAQIYPDDGDFFTTYFHSTNTDPEKNTSGVRILEVTESEFNACKQELLDHVLVP